MKKTDLIVSGALAAGVMLAGASVQAQTPAGLTWLGSLSGLNTYTEGMSADGRVIIGDDVTVAGDRPIFWVENGGLGYLSTPSGYAEGTAYGVSADGTVIAGKIYDGFFERAARWTAGSVTELGTLGGDRSRAFGVSGDGRVIVGEAELASSIGHAFRWTESGGMEDLGSLGGGSSIAYATSGNGSVVVGLASDGSVSQAFRWQGGTMVGLGALPGAIIPINGVISNALDVSSDGNVVVGAALNAANTTEAFRWHGGMMVGLGIMSGHDMSLANAVSANGLVVVGLSGMNDGSGYFDDPRAFRWTEGTGMQSVEEWLRAANPSFALAAGDTLSEATGVSATGAIVSGWGELGGVEQPWIARVGEEQGGGYSGLLGVADFYSSLADVRQVGAVGNAHIGSFMGNTLSLGRFVARRPYVAPAAGESAWNRLTLSVQADWQIYDRDAIDGNQGSGALMLAYAPSADWQIGVGYAYGVLSVTQDERSGIKDRTHTRMPHHTLGLFAQYGKALGWQARGAFAYGWSDPRIKRSYFNGAQSVTSAGDTSVDMLGLEGEGGYTFGVAPNVSLQPYAGLSWLRSSMDAYTETGGTGSFPARFDKRTDSEWRGRVGLEGLWQVAPTVGLTSGVSHTRQFGGSSDNVSGAMSGLFDFSTAVSKADSSWTTFDVGTRIDLADRTRLGLGAGVNVSGSDAQPSYFVSARISMGF